MKITCPEKTKDGLSFPMLMINPETDCIFLITSRGETGCYTGMQLTSNATGKLYISYQEDYWTRDLVPYTGTLLIEND